MARIIKTLIFTALMGFQAVNAVNITIEGHVIDSIIGNPVQGHAVYIFTGAQQPQGFNYFNVIYTDAMGYFKDIVPVPSGNEAFFFVLTIDCNKQYHVQTISSDSTNPLYFNICTNANTLCQADYHAFVSPSNPKLVYFTDQSVGNYNQRNWSFGDGGTSSLSNPIHFYQTPGNYPVCLSISSNDTFNPCNDIYCDTLQVSNFQTFCYAAFSWHPNTVNPLKFQFLDHSLGNPNDWYWDFGDGDTSSQHNPWHEYQAPGAYNVCLTISRGSPGSPQHCSDTRCILLVTDTLMLPCQADFTVSPDPFDPFTFHFNDQSTGNFNSLVWDFGDGNTATGPLVSHTYNAQGTFSVCLVVSNTNPVFPCNDTMCRQVIVSSPGNFNLAGQVFSGLFPSDIGQVQLFREINGIYMLDQTAALDSFGVYYFYQALGAKYLLKASLSSSSSAYGQYFPTYSGKTFNWKTASPLMLNHHIFNANIELLPVPGYSAGQALIKGSVVYSDKHPVKKGKPAPGIEIMLLSASGNPLALRFTDSTGFFAFENVGFGHYQLTAEVTGINTDPVDIFPNNGHPVVDNIQFIIEPMYVVSVFTGENDPLEAKIFPNPAGNNLFMSFNSVNPQFLEVRVLDLTGHPVFEERLMHAGGEGIYSFPVGHLKNGMYLLQILYSDNQTITKKFIKN